MEGKATEASTPRRKLSAILMVDVSGFGRMMGRDEEGTTALIREFHTRTRSLVDAHEGRVVDTAGDSVFGEFDSVINAVRCAQAIQQTESTVNAARPPEERVAPRIGVHLGDVIVQDYHVYGDGVNIAARLQAVADPGSICVSEAVYQQVYKKLDLAFEDLGVQELKNIEHPIRLYRVVLPGHDGPVALPQRPRQPLQAPDPDASRPATVRAKRIRITSSKSTSTVNQSGIYDLIIVGSSNLVATAQGNRIKTIKIAGSNNTLTIGKDNSVDQIVTAGTNNKIRVPSGSGITISTNTGNNNQVQTYHPD
ncbi:MAG: adenylate/guanylate cyclase domain-containing protein [Armatimonadota bacterium]